MNCETVETSSLEAVLESAYVVDVIIGVTTKSKKREMKERFNYGWKKTLGKIQWTQNKISFG